MTRVFEDFRYVRELGSPNGRDSALAFEATVDGNQLEGCDFLHLDDESRIDQFAVT